MAADRPDERRIAERVTPVASVAMALAAFACCVPLGLVGAIGVLSAGALFEAVQPWLPGVATVLLALGAWQAFRGQRACRRRVSKFTLLVLALSASVTFGVLLFPQTVASLIADFIL